MNARSARFYMCACGCSAGAGEISAAEIADALVPVVELPAEVHEPQRNHQLAGNSARRNRPTAEQKVAAVLAKVGTR